MKISLAFSLWGAMVLSANAYPLASQDFPPVNPPVTPRTSNTKGSTEKVQDTKVTTDAGTTKTSTDTLTGKVEEFQPSKSITVTTPGKVESTRTIDLTGKNLTAHVAAGVKAKDWVTVTTKTDRDGHKTITVERAKQPQ
ncbi:MAG TPA: hypothetical protein VKE70_11040 [Candidatus Solibacter sp.]|nr:hypothetical protein [Candidatus Solibacter sp.]